MSFFGFLVLSTVAALCGSIGAALAGFKTSGCITNIVLGLIGALIGSWFSRELGIRDFLYLENIPVFWSIIGSTIFIALITALTSQKPKRRK